jgi:hypothetical protein
MNDTNKNWNFRQWTMDLHQRAQQKPALDRKSKVQFWGIFPILWGFFLVTMKVLLPCAGFNLHWLQNLEVICKVNIGMSHKHRITSLCQLFICAHILRLHSDSPHSCVYVLSNYYVPSCLPSRWPCCCPPTWLYPLTHHTPWS